MWLDQVHGRDVVVVDRGDDPARRAGTAGDAAVTGRDDIALAVHSADCATVALWSTEGVIGVAHAGWKGLEAGVIGATAAAMAAAGATSIQAVTGPCIGPECYEFGATDLDRLADLLGSGVRGVTSTGAAALDLRAGVALALAAADVELVGASDLCTACAAGVLWSHRARAETGRQAMVTWIEST